jgi:hypothetical protein
MIVIISEDDDDDDDDDDDYANFSSDATSNQALTL